jgi:hypothetical protein
MAKIDGEKLGFFVRMFAPVVFNGLEFACEKIENEGAKELCLLALKELEKVVELLTDDIKENGKQFEEHYSEHGAELAIELVKIVEKLVKNGKGGKNDEVKKRLTELLNG